MLPCASKCTGMKDLKAYSEQELWQLVQQRHQQAFDELYYRFVESLLQTAFQKTNDRHLADDLVQDLFVWIWEHAPAVSWHTHFNVAAYLHTALRHKIYNYYHRRLKAQAILADIQQYTGEATPHLQQQLEHREVIAAVHHEIEALPTAMKKIFQLSRNEDKSIPEIAGTLALSKQTVKNQLGIAVKRLRSSVDRLQSWLF
jgi:RNA polymerase sigma factor (sigma-70 family)